MKDLLPLRRLVVCLDGRRIPLNREERAEMSGDVPYWGANGVVDGVDRPLFSEQLVLLGEDGAPFDDPFAVVAFRVDEPVWVNNHIHVLRPLSGVDARYLTYALNSVDWMPYVTGSTRLKLTQDDMMSVPIVSWSTPMQRAIADFLDSETARIDALISKKRRMAVVLAEREAGRLRGVMEELLRMWPAIPAKRLVSEFDERLGEHPPPPLLSVSIYRGVVPRDELTDKLPRAEQLTSYKVCQPGDIAINRMRAFQGGVGVVTAPGIVSPDYTVLRLGSRVRPDFLHFVLRSSWFVGEMTRRVRGIGGVDQGNVRTPRLNFSDLGLIRIPIPPIDEQLAIAQRLQADSDAEHRVRKRLGRQLCLLEEHRQALITAAVTGELEVPGVAA